MKLRSAFVLIVLFICSFHPSYGQKNKRLQLEWAIRNAKTEFQKTTAFLKLGEYYMETNFVRLDSLIRVIEKAIVPFSKPNKIKLTLFIAQANEKIGNYPGFISSMMYFENLDYSKIDSKTRIEILGDLGFAYTFQNDRKKTKEYLNRALALAQSNRDYTQVTTILNIKAYDAVINKERVKALDYCERAIEYAKRAHDKKELAYSYNTLANIYRFFGDNDISIRKNFLAFELAYKNKFYHEISYFAIEIGQLQESVTNLSGAKYYYDISLKNAAKIHDKSQMGFALSSIANILRKENKLNESQQMNFKALKMVNPELDQIRLGDIEKNIGLNYSDLKKYNEAIEHYKTSIIHYEDGQNIGRTTDVYKLIGEAYMNKKQLPKALEYLLKSKKTAESFGAKKAKISTYPMIAEIYSRIGEKDLALQYLTQYIDYLDEIKADDADKKIAQLGEEFRADERNKMIAEQSENLEKQKQIRQLTEAELENATLRSRLQTYFIIAFLILIVLATIIGTYRSRQAAAQRKRKQAEMSQTLLRSQMNPHFIFNAMSVIQSYIYDNDVENSSQFLVSFSRLIRLILENSPKEFISIETEIDILNKYLETQKIRFEKRFEFEIICPENLIYEKTLIPPMITQPFVENAIEHGELHQIENGKITIQFSKKDDMLHVEIEDNGIGRKSSEKNKPEAYHKSMATSITEERIRIMNETENSIGYLSVTDGNILDGTGTKVTISLPFKKEISLNKI